MRAERKTSLADYGLPCRDKKYLSGDYIPKYDRIAWRHLTFNSAAERCIPRAITQNEKHIVVRTSHALLLYFGN